MTELPYSVMSPRRAESHPCLGGWLPRAMHSSVDSSRSICAGLLYHQ